MTDLVRLGSDLDAALGLVQSVFARELSLPPDHPALGPDRDLAARELGFSSFTFVRAVIAIEDEVGVELADDVFAAVHHNGTVRDVARILEAACAREGGR
jgi:acyl carrier protein